MPIKPAEATQESPLVLFVAAVTAMSAARQELLSAQVYLGDPEWRIFLEDITMMTAEHVIHGLRTPWVRRVAIPIYKAQEALSVPRGSEAERAKLALEILDQCTDTDLRNRCQQWIQDTYKVL